MALILLLASLIPFAGTIEILASGHVTLDSLMVARFLNGFGILTSIAAYVVDTNGPIIGYAIADTAGGVLLLVVLRWHSRRLPGGQP